MTRINKTDSLHSLPLAQEETSPPTTKEITAKLTQLFKKALKELAEGESSSPPYKKPLEKK